MNVNDLFPSRWLCGDDLGGKQVTVAIDKFSMEEVFNKNQTEMVPTVSFQKAKKGLILNKTNAFIIAKLHGPDTDAWPGKRVTLYAKTVYAFGEEHNAVRVSDKMPEPSPAPPKTPPPLQGRNGEPITAPTFAAESK